MAADLAEGSVRSARYGKGMRLFDPELLVHSINYLLFEFVFVLIHLTDLSYQLFLF